MKILRAVFSWIGMVLSIVLSLALGFVEGRTLFSGDWKLAENPALAGFGYAMRLIYFVLLLAFAVLAIINEVSSSFKLGPLAILAPCALVIGAVASFLFYQWYICAALIFATGLLGLEVSTKKKE